MTRILVKLYAGTGEPAVGAVTWVATSRTQYLDGLLLPSSRTYFLYDGEALVNVPPSPTTEDPAWAWTVTEHIKGGGGGQRLVAVPDSAEILSYRDDLIDLIPADLGEPPGEPGATGNHGNLLGLEDDDHPQYFNTTRGDARYIRTVNGVGPDGSGNVEVMGGGSGDHGELTGLGDDDHTQYHNDARGDVRYYTKSQVDVALGGKADDPHTHDVGDINATGTADSTTFLRGDGTWSTPGGGSTIEHHDLGGLTDDDHPQYHNDTRGDLRYYTQTQLDTALGLLAPKASPTFTGTVSGITKAMVGLGNVDNTSDNNKPISSATQTALNGKSNTGHGHAISDVADLSTQLAAKAPTASPTFTGTVSGVTKAHVGLADVDNTSDADKPISTATQAALDALDGDVALKADADRVDAKVTAAETAPSSPVTGDVWIVLPVS